MEGRPCGVIIGQVSFTALQTYNINYYDNAYLWPMGLIASLVPDWHISSCDTQYRVHIWTDLPWAKGSKTKIHHQPEHQIPTKRFAKIHARRQKAVYDYHDGS